MKKLFFLFLISISSVFANVDSTSSTSNSIGITSGNDPIHATAKKHFWKRKLNQLELIGDAAIHQRGGTLLADYALIDQNLKTITAKGNCVYLTGDSTLLGDEMYISMNSSTGLIINGRVISERFNLSGERIYRLGPTEYRTQGSEYTTCHDCSRSWTIATEDMKMEIEGYARMKDVVFKVKDAPVFWLPYLIVPVKTKRQTGFLFPRLGASTLDGFVFVQPFFWAINPHMDMTIGVGDYSNRGRRFEWEYRYAAAERSFGNLNIFYLNDKGQQPSRPDRAAFDVSIHHAFPWKIDGKFRMTEITDNRYPILVGDVPGRGELVLPSRLMFSRRGSWMSVYADARRYRHLFNAGLVGFDDSTVQVMPEIYATTNNQLIGNTGIALALGAGVTRFYRSGSPFDYDNPDQNQGPFSPGIDPIRRADRYLISPTLTTSYRLWDRFVIRPSSQYWIFHYDFNRLVPNLTRAYMQNKIDFYFQIERVFNNQNPEIPKTKHLIRPMLTYAWIPRGTIEEPEHPFIRQMERVDGYNFDNYDRIPFNNSQTQLNYFIPLGNSLTYGLTSQLIRRMGALDKPGASYQNSVEFQSGQTLNINEFKKPEAERQPFSRAFGTLMTSFNNWTSNTNYFYYPYLPGGERHVVRTSMGYIFERGLRQGVLQFDRSVNLGYYYSKVGARSSGLNASIRFSINDYILPSYFVNYDFVSRQALTTGGSLTFQSPSRCWLITLAYNQSIDRPGVQWAPQFSLNLTGSGFFNIQSAGTGAPM